MKKLYLILTILLLLPLLRTNASSDMSQRVNGRILLQVENKGEAWYVNPVDLKRYYLGRPADAFELMRRLGLGITNKDLEQISIGQIGENGNTNPSSLAKNNAGRILLQVENKGEAWYVNPVDLKRYYLGRPADAFELMRRLGLGISNNDLNQISIFSTQNSQPQPVVTPEPGANQTISGAAAAIRQGDTEKTLAYFTEEMQKAVQYTMDFLDKEQKFVLSGILSSAKLTKSGAEEKTYTTEVYFNGAKHPVNFLLKKKNGKWLMTNL